jgi:hypothetical protein
MPDEPDDQPERPVRQVRYRRAFSERARAAAEVGLTLYEISRLLGVDLDTLNLWTMVYPEFAAAMRANAAARNQRVEAALYQRAVGYEHPSEQLFLTRDGTVVRVPTMRHVPADSVAGVRWLERRDPDRWATSRGDEEAGVLRIRIENDPDAPDA